MRPIDVQSSCWYTLNGHHGELRTRQSLNEEDQSSRDSLGEMLVEQQATSLETIQWKDVACTPLKWRLLISRTLSIYRIPGLNCKRRIFTTISRASATLSLTSWSSWFWRTGKRSPQATRCRLSCPIWSQAVWASDVWHRDEQSALSSSTDLGYGCRERTASWWTFSISHRNSLLAVGYAVGYIPIPIDLTLRWKIGSSPNRQGKNAGLCSYSMFLKLHALMHA